MKTIQANQTVDIPPDVTVSIKSRLVTVTGPLGTLKRNFRHIQVDMHFVDKNCLKVEMWWVSPKQAACIRTICTHIKNMIIGVTKGFVYKMRFVYAHFPIIVTILKGDKEVEPLEHGNAIEIRNFLGEREVRKVEMLKDCTVTRTHNVKDEISVHGCDLEKVAQSAANIHMGARVRGKDIRKFLDGIYVSQRVLGDLVKDV